jgi:hypothetical protein
MQKALFTQQRGLSFAAIFTDITAASRRLTEIPLEDYLLDDAVLSAAGINEHIAEVMQAAFRHTWISVQGEVHIATTEGGTMPGDPWADLLFNLVFFQSS